MYWWNIKALREELKLNVITEREKMKYVLAHWILVGVNTIPLPGTLDTSLLETWGGIVGLAITIFGILRCYEANRSGDGQRFVERFICIGWPILVRLTIYLLPPLIVFLILLSYEVTFFVFVIGGVILEFLWIRSELLKISGAGETVPITG